MSLAEGEVLPPSPRRRYAAKCFMVMVCGGGLLESIVGAQADYFLQIAGLTIGRGEKRTRDVNQI